MDYQDRLRQQEFDLLCDGLDLDTVKGRRILSERIKASGENYDTMTELMIKDAEQRGFPNWWASMDELAAWERERTRKHGPAIGKSRLLLEAAKLMETHNFFSEMAKPYPPHTMQELRFVLIDAVTTYRLACISDSNSLRMLAGSMDRLQEWAERLDMVDAPDVRGFLVPEPAPDSDPHTIDMSYANMEQATKDVADELDAEKVRLYEGDTTCEWLAGNIVAIVLNTMQPVKATKED